MQFSWYPLALIGFSLAGLAICFYIWRSKYKKTPVVCPLNGSCMEVLTSRFSKTFGIPNEVTGALYYLTMASGTAMLLAQPVLATTGLPWVLLGASALAFAASVYLVGIQVFVIKHLCSWCLTTAVINGTLLMLVFAV